jgi:hypothetical protein
MGRIPMDNACQELLKALSEAEGKGTSVAVDELGKKITIPPGKTLADVFEACKDKGWIMGSLKGPWLTAQGRKKAAG